VIRIHSKISNPLMSALPIISCIVMAWDIYYLSFHVSFGCRSLIFYE
jgi:hypothetical protein